MPNDRGLAGRFISLDQAHQQVARHASLNDYRPTVVMGALMRRKDLILRSIPAHHPEFLPARPQGGIRTEKGIVLETIPQAGEREFEEEFNAYRGLKRIHRPLVYYETQSVVKIPDGYQVGIAYFLQLYWYTGPEVLNHNKKEIHAWQWDTARDVEYEVVQHTRKKDILTAALREWAEIRREALVT